MADVVMIEVAIPGEPAAKWQALNRRSAIRQAKIEAERGALVRVEVNGRLVWTNHDGPMK